MSSEEDKAKAAASAGGAKSEEKTVFAKILDKEIPCDFIHEDDQCVAFKDASPQAPVHFLVIPKKTIAMLDDVKDSDEKVGGTRRGLLVIFQNKRKVTLVHGSRMTCSITCFQAEFVTLVTFNISSGSLYLVTVPLREEAHLHFSSWGTC